MELKSDDIFGRRKIEGFSLPSDIDGNVDFSRPPEPSKFWDVHDMAFVWFNGNKSSGLVERKQLTEMVV